MKKSILLLLACGLVASFSISRAADFSGWGQSLRITFEGYDRPSTLTNFPALVVLNDGLTNFSYADFDSATGGDLRFTDGERTNELNYEIESWDTNGDSFVWVQVPRLRDSATAIQAYWSRTGATAPPYTTNGAVWDAGFESVFHMNNTNATDATAFFRHGAAMGLSNTTGSIGNGLGFPGVSNAFVSVTGYKGVLGTTSRTISAWIHTTDPDDSAIVGWGAVGTGTRWDLRTQDDNGTVGAARVEIGGGRRVGATAVNSGTWVHVAAAWSPDTSPNINDLRLLVNGQIDTPYNSVAQPVNTLPQADLSIGKYSANGTLNFVGSMDEVRISSVDRSDDWLWTEWRNAVSNDSFHRYEAVPPGAPNVRIDTGAENLTWNGARLNGYLESTGQAATVVHFFFGGSDAGTNKAAWSGSVDLGPQLPGTLFTDLTTLRPGQTYVYRVYASNTAGEAWSTATETFRTEMLTTEFTHRLRIDFCGYNRTTPLTNFPALVILSTNLPGFSYADLASPNGFDLRFTDSNQVASLNYDVDVWNTNGASYLWVQVPRLEPNGFIYASWGSPADTVQPGYTLDGSTWAENYELVYHMNRTNALDASPHQRHGASFGNLDGAGFVGGAQSFSGTNGVRIEVAGYQGVLGTNARSVTAWIRTTDNTGGIVGWGQNTTGNRYDYFVQNANGTIGATRIEIQGGRRVANTAVTNDQWHHVALRWAPDANPNVNDHQLYLNGARDNPYNTGGQAMNTLAGVDVVIGRKANLSMPYQGLIDELRISSSDRSDDWVWAVWFNMASNRAFQCYGPIESGMAPLIENLPASSVTPTTADLNGRLTSTGTVATTVTVYAGPADGGTNAAAWSTNFTFGATTAMPPIVFSTNQTGLAPGFFSYYRFAASNAFGMNWAPNSQRLLTPAPPVVNNATGATNIGTGTASLQGSYETDQRGAIRVYWGEADGGIDTGLWTNVEDLGAIDTPTFAAGIGGAYYGIPYYYRVFATNTFGTNWAPATTNFFTASPGGFALNNIGASYLGASSAVVSVDFSGAGSVFDLLVYWNTSDGGTNAAAWTNSAAITRLTDVASTNVSVSITGLVSATSYFFTFRISNLFEDIWLTLPLVRETQSAPAVNNGDGPTGLSQGTAWLQGDLTSGGAADATIFYGRSDAATNTASWEQRIDFGQLAVGNFSNQVTGLTFGYRYYYRAFASNDFGAAWAPATTNFIPAMPPGNHIQNRPASDITTTSAVLNADLAALDAVYGVTVFYGVSDGGTVASAWSNQLFIGWFTNTEQRVDQTVQGLSHSNVYFFTFSISNAITNIWASPLQSFRPSGGLGLFANSTRLTFCGYNPPDTNRLEIKNFPTLVRLSTNIPGFNYGQFNGANAGDLRFMSADNSRELTYEIDTWDTNGVSAIWVQTTIQTSNDFINMYWGNPIDVNAPTYTTNGAVWTEGYNTVYHLSETNAVDATRNNPDGTANGNVTVPGVTGAGQAFNRANAHILSSGPSILASNFSVSVWGRQDIIGGDTDIMVARQDGVGQGRSWMLINGGEFRSFVGGSSTFTGFQIQSNVWHHFAFVYTNASVRLYADGRFRGASSNLLETATGSFVLGLHRLLMVQDYEGTLDEFRFAPTQRSENWIWASWFSVASNESFICYDPVTSLPAADLRLIKTVSSTNLLSGTNLIYTLDVSNISTLAVDNATLVDILPSDVTFSSSIPAPSSQSGTTNTFILSPLPGGATTSIIIQVTVTSTNIGTITNLASISTTNLEFYLNNNTGFATTVIPDSDGDGIPNPVDPDDDNDRFPDTSEVIAGTDPFDPNSFLWVVIERNTGAPMSDLGFPAFTGRTYRVEWTTNIYTGPWIVSQSNITTVLPGWLVQPESNANQRVYYRIGVETPW